MSYARITVGELLTFLVKYADRPQALACEVVDEQGIPLRAILPTILWKTKDGRYTHMSSDEAKETDGQDHLVFVLYR